MARTTESSKKPPRRKGKPLSPEGLAKGGKTGGAELSEDELKDVAGGFSWGESQK